MFARNNNNRHTKKEERRTIENKIQHNFSHISGGTIVNIVHHFIFFVSIVVLASNVTAFLYSCIYIYVRKKPKVHHVINTYSFFSICMFFFKDALPKQKSKRNKTKQYKKYFTRSTNTWCLYQGANKTAIIEFIVFSV